MGTQATYYAKLAEKSVNDERNISELMTKLTKDQAELHKHKEVNSRSVKEAQDMGFDQVKMLQHELERQSSYFKMEEKQYLDEIKEL